MHASSANASILYMERLFSGGYRCQGYFMEVFDKLIEVRLLKRFGLSGLLEAVPDATIWGVLVLLVFCVLLLKNTQEKVKLEKYNGLRSVLTVVLLVWCVISLSDVSVFLYFNF